MGESYNSQSAILKLDDVKMADGSLASHRGQILSIAVIGIMAASALAGVVLYLQYAAPQERSGPISGWPAAWSNVCNIPGQSKGNDTTNVGNIHTSYTSGMDNLTLDQLYSSITKAQSFKNYTTEKGWVATYWGSQLITGPGFSDSYIVTSFILLSHAKPNGYLTTYYNIATSVISSNYQDGIAASCPAMK
jgi:hypothetical protein